MQVGCSTAGCLASQQLLLLCSLKRHLVQFRGSALHPVTDRVSLCVQTRRRLQAYGWHALCVLDMHRARLAHICALSVTGFTKIPECWVLGNGSACGRLQSTDHLVEVVLLVLLVLQWCFVIINARAHRNFKLMKCFDRLAGCNWMKQLTCCRH